jgi:hypothetical protein
MAVDLGLNLLLGDVVEVRHVESLTGEDVLIGLRGHEIWEFR